MKEQKHAKLALIIAKNIQQKVDELGITKRKYFQETSTHDKIFKQELTIALGKVSTTLADSYYQVKRDIESNERKSWAGTAHEIREILANLLRYLAPDDQVLAQKWFKKETESGKPSQKQRVIYILQNRGSSSRSIEVVQKVEILDEMVGKLVRSKYDRASDAAHTFETKKEVVKLLRYFEAFTHDLLDL